MIGDANKGGGRQSPDLAVVHHGHQHLITDGYDNHEGVAEVLDAFSAVLALHLRYRVPLNLHVSGTFLEATAWHRPEFFGWVRALLAEGLVEVLGSAYSQPILTLFGTEHNRRQLDEELALLVRHLGVGPAELRGFWVPERVWDTRRLSKLVTAPGLANGGYQWVLVDDRLWYPPEGDGRARFDRGTAPGQGLGTAGSGVGGGAGGTPAGRGGAGGTPAGHGGAGGTPAGRGGAGGTPAGRGAAAPTITEGGEPWGDGRELRPALIQGGGGLVAVPISGDLRYSLPPRSAGDRDLLARVMAMVAGAGPGALAVYADDLEKTAGVGAWAPRPWNRKRLDEYERFLDGLTEPGAPRAVLISAFLEEHPPVESRRLAPGTFYELSAGGAGEDYHGWWDALGYAPYRRHLRQVEHALTGKGRAPTNGNGNGNAPLFADTTGPGGLVDLAWKQLLVATYETAWHGLGGRPDEVAPWARATASHVRSAHSTLAAARWARRPQRIRVWTEDIDRDGENEVMLANEHLFAVITPRWGARVVALFDVAVAGGRMVVGNPCDDWNWQEEVNRFMAVPANHPGAFADDGFENDHWTLVSGSSTDRWVDAVFRNCELASPLFGSVKRYRLVAGEPALEVTYALGLATEAFSVTHGLSPDYLHLLRHGRAGLEERCEPGLRGWAAGHAAVGVRIGRNEPVVFAEPSATPSGHVLRVRTVAYRSPFTLTLETSPVRAGRAVEVDLTTPALAERP